MNILLMLLQIAPGREQTKITLDPILRHGRENISYLYTLDSFDWTIIILYFTILILLSILGIYRLRMVYQFWRYRHISPQPKGCFGEGELPSITVQLPLYNELYVVERLLESVTQIDYPRRLLEIQVLDDSTDETVSIAAAAVARYKDQG
ncbi:MAG: glycosyltransferase, partial [Blastocatellia bacterium]|nr:glycosyltransferase [Blastocatellia bacterium]